MSIFLYAGKQAWRILRSIKGGKEWLFVRYLTMCIFFNDQMENMPGTADFFKKKYCQGIIANARGICTCEIGKAECAQGHVFLTR